MPSATVDRSAKAAATAASVARNKAAILDERDRRAETTTALPFYYHVHLNKPCNQRCIMCAPGGLLDKTHLSLEEFVAFFEKVEAYAEHFTLLGGEPFMYPYIREVLELLAQRPIAVSINTNATLLHGGVVDRLLAVHELYLKCSIDAATRDAYHRIRGTDSFDRVVANIEHFVARSRGKPNLRTILVYVVMRETLGEVLPFLELAQRLGAHRVEFHPVRHVGKWRVSNGTGWTFDGASQSCDAIKDEFNDVMREAAGWAVRAGIDCETHIIG